MDPYMPVHDRGAESDRRIVMTKMAPRQAEILQLISEGRTVAQVAEMLNVSPRTVSNQLSLARKATAPKQRLAGPTVDPLVVLAKNAGRRALAQEEVQNLLALVKAFRTSQAETRRLAALNADFQQVIRHQRAELLRNGAEVRP